MFFILSPDISLPKAPVHSHLQGLLQIPAHQKDNLLAVSLINSPAPHGDDALAPNTNWNVVEQRLGELFLDRLDIFLHQIGSQQPDLDIIYQGGGHTQDQTLCLPHSLCQIPPLQETLQPEGQPCQRRPCYLTDSHL